jgi:phosphoglycolate phosphatase-like HAD superfamily hydrolase
MGASGMKTVIFDLDGTLADINHRLPFVQNGRKEWDAFYKACPADGPKHDIIELARMCEDAGHHIIISSGRSADVEAVTVDWLKKHKVPYNELHMRPNACFTPDQALKKAWLDQGKFGPKENILFVVEDRDRMVQMWRQQGLTVLQVEQWVEEGEQSFPLKKIELARNMAKYISATGQDARFNQWTQGQVK